MKTKILSAIVAVSLTVFGIAAVGCSSPDNEQVIKDTIAKEFDIYKNKDQAAISKVMESAENSGLAELGITGEEFAAGILEGFDYSIDSIEVDGTNATANVTIVSKSMTDFNKKFNAKIDTLVDATEGAGSQNATTKVGQYALEAFKETNLISERAILRFELQGNTWVSTNVAQVMADLDSMVFAS